MPFIYGLEFIDSSSADHPMSTAQRREREFAAREKAILGHARTMIRDAGFLNLQMAELARRSEYATGTLYHHFRCKEDLLYMLATEGMQERQIMLRRVVDWDANSRDRMAATGYADWLFVEAHPDHFRLEQLVRAADIWMRATPQVRESTMDYGEACARLVFGIVGDAARTGDLDLKDRTAQQIAFGFWTMSVGTHTMTHAEGLIERLDVRQPYVMLARNYQALLNALNWMPLQDPGDENALHMFFERVHSELFSDYPVPRWSGRKDESESQDDA